MDKGTTEAAAVAATSLTTEEQWTFDRIQEGYTDAIPRAVFVDSEGEPIGIPLLTWNTAIVMALAVRLAGEVETMRGQRDSFRDHLAIADKRADAASDLLRRIVTEWRESEIGDLDGDVIEEAEKLLGIEAPADPLEV